MYLIIAINCFKKVRDTPMKRTMISLIIASIVVMPGCYDPGKNATVRINLGNIPESAFEPKKHFIDRVLELFSSEAYAQTTPNSQGIVMLYLAALNGDTVMAQRPISINEIDGDSITQTVEFEVPAASGIDIVVIAENGSDIITWYGKTSEPVDLAVGDEISVEVSMQALTYTLLNVHRNPALSRAEWDKLTGASEYNLYDSSYNLLGSTTGSYYPMSVSSGNLEVEFSFAGKNSNFLWFS